MHRKVHGGFKDLHSLHRMGAGVVVNDKPPNGTHFEPYVLATGCLTSDIAAQFITSDIAAQFRPGASAHRFTKSHRVCCKASAVGSLLSTLIPCENAALTLSLLV